MLFGMVGQKSTAFEKIAKSWFIDDTEKNVEGSSQQVFCRDNKLYVINLSDTLVYPSCPDFSKCFKKQVFEFPTIKLKRHHHHYLFIDDRTMYDFHNSTDTLKF